MDCENKINRQAIAERLISLRKKKNETQEDVARAIEVSVSAITMYETAQRVPRDEIKIALAKHFGVSVKSIFFT